jgi:hypothetical protein
VRPIAYLVLVGLPAAGCATSAETSPEAPVPPPPADLVLSNGVIRVGTLTGTVSQLAIRSGRIQAWGDDLRPYLGAGTRRIDLQGSAVLPGFVDASVDLMAVGRRRLALDLVGTPSPGEAAARVEAELQKRPDGWIYGRGWDRRDFRPPRYPDRRVLDAVSKDVPVVLENIDGKALWVNGAALAEAGIGPATPNPVGGKILRNRRGRPTGILLGSATRLVMERMPPPRGPRLARVLLAAQREFAAAGMVEVHDLRASPATVEALRRLDRAQDLVLRVRAFHDGRALALSELLEEGPHRGRRLTVDGVHFGLDGPLHQGNAALHAPYAGRPGWRGAWSAPPELVKARALSAASQGFRLAFSAHGDRAVARALDVVEAMVNPAPARLHGVRLISGPDLRRAVDAGVWLSVVPGRTVREYASLPAWLGPERSRAADAWRTWRTAGATLAWASDAPAEDPAAPLTLSAVTSRTNLLGEPKGGFVPSERIAMDEAILIYGGGGPPAPRLAEAGAGPEAPGAGGKAPGAGGKEPKGALDGGSPAAAETAPGIRVGAPADLTVLSHDPLRATELQLATARVRLTLVAGEIAYALPGADLPPVQPFPQARTSTAASAPEPR